MQNLFSLLNRSRLGHALRAVLLLGLSGLASSASGQTFAPFTAYSTGAGTNPQSVALGDVNGDGRFDVVTGNASTNTVGVLLGQAGGTFASVVAYSTGATNGVRSVALGDVNGDGRLDIVAAIYSAGAVSVLLGQAGGTFAPAVYHSVPNNSPFFATLGDVNGDGRLDIVTANVATGTVGVLLGQAGGTFAPGVAYSTGASTSPRTAALGDVNGDGRLDVVTANANTGSRTVGVLLGQAGGTFAPVVAYSTGAVNDPYFATLGDVNADGRPDIITANLYQNTVSVLLGQAGGVFAPAVAYSTGAGSNPSGVALGDMNGDGRPDIVAATTGTNLSVGVLFGQAGGTFAPVVAYSTGAGSGPYAVALGDVNADGRPDIVTANSNQNTASVLLNTTAPTLTNLSPTSGPVGTSVTLTGTSLNGATGVSFNGTAASTFAGVNATTVTATVPTGATTGNVTLTTPGGTTNGLAFTVTVPVPILSVITPNTALVGATVSLTGTGLTGTTSITFAGTSNNVVSSGYSVNGAGTQITGIVIPSGAATGNVTVTTPGGTSNGVNFTVSAQPSLTSITPTSGVAGTTVTLNGANLSGATTITFAGTSPNTVTTGFAVNSAGTQITGVVVPGGAATGNVTVTTPGGTSNGVAFTVTAAPVISSFSPASGPVGTSVTVTGTNLSGASAVAFNGTAAPGYAVNAGGTQLTVAVPTGASTGLVTVTAPGGTATSATSFTVTAAPVISAFTPAYVQPGDALTITGQNLLGLTQLKIGGAVQLTFTVNAAGTQITTTVPGASYVVNGTTYPLTSRLLAVTTPSGTAASATKLRIFSVTGYYDGAQGYATPPSQVQGGLYRLRTGDQVFVRGSGFLGATGAAFVAGAPTGCGSTAPLTATPTILNDSMLYVPFQYNLAGNGYFTTGVSITTSLGSQTAQGYNGNAYFFNPQIDSPFASCLSPTSGPASTRVTVTGSWSFGGNSATGLTFNGVAGQNFTASTSGTQQTVSADLPASLSPGAVAVRVTGSGPGFASATDLSVVLSFTLIGSTGPPAPALSSLSASSGPVGTSLTLTGTNLTSTSSITFAGTSNNTVTTGFTVNAAGTQITGVIVPTGAQTGNVTVTTPGGSSNGLAFRLILAPVLTSFTPASGPVGTSVTLSGQNLSATSAVAFNGTAASGYVVNAAGTQLTVAVPMGTSTGPVSITTPGGMTTSVTNFTVTVPTALAITGTTAAQTGSSYCVAATVKDQFNNPVVGVRVDFAVSGVNSTSGFATTDATGVAPFCYTGTTAGTDNVVASIGALSKTDQVTWSGSCQAPTNVAVTSLTSTTASVSFTGSATASGGYTVRYTLGGGAAQTAQATASPVALTGLLPNTTYALTVTSNCAGTQLATSTPAVSFTTSAPSPVCNRNVNQPMAAADHLVASAGPLTFTAAQLLANDSDPRNRALRVSHVGKPSAGTLVTNTDGTYTYTAPYPSYTGPVTFSYTIEGTGPVIASPGTYHYYEFVSAPGICWTDAQAAAAARTYEGMQGYLATITFAGEKDFLAGRALGQYWIGAADEAVEGEWRWKTGPEAGQLFWRGAANGIGLAYANWSPGQPDDFHNYGHPEGEDYGIFYGSSGYWNDVNNCNTGGTTAGYLVEYGGLEPCVPILYSLGTVTIMVGPSTQQSMRATASAALRAATGELALQIAPNPSTGQFRVQVMADLAGPAQLDLIDMQGRLVRSLFTGSLPAGESREVAVDAPDLSSGMYIVRLQSGQQVQHLRVLIQK